MKIDEVLKDADIINHESIIALDKLQCKEKDGNTN
jgi:hypothetical protein